MYRPTYRFVALALIAVLCQLTRGSGARAKEEVPSQEIDRAVHQYFSSLAKRDAAGMQAILDDWFVVIEAGKDAQPHVLDTKNRAQLLPPEGNDDWQNVTLSQVKVQISSTNPSVATVSFTIIVPVDDKRLSYYRDVINNPSSQFTESQRAEFKKIVDAKCVSNSMFGMLAKHGGKWRIICLTLPE